MVHDSVRLEILIPTYQRAEVLLENLGVLAKHLRNEGQGKVLVRIRDNASTDGTDLRVGKFVNENADLNWIFDSNEENIGGEPNCISLLESAESDYVMFLGDDDYLPKGYLSFVISEIESNTNTTVIISGFSELLPDGTILPARYENFEILRLQSSSKAVRQLMPFGHQLSGLMFRRAGVVKAYLDHPNSRNMYPFMFFLGHCARQGDCVYAPMFQVHVSQGATRHWNYDKSALFRDMLVNYDMLFPGMPIERWRAQLSLLRRNWARLGGSSLARLPSSFPDVVLYKRLDWLTRLTLILLFPFLFIRATLGSILRSMGQRKSGHDMLKPSGAQSD